MRHLAALLKGLARDELPFAARLILGRVQPLADTRTLGVGWALLSAVAAEVSGHSQATIGLESRKVGDFGDALEHLLPASPTRHLPLREVPPLIEALAKTPDRNAKHEVLHELLTRAAPWEARYLVKALLGELRIGVQQGIFEEALAAAFDVPLDELRRAAALTPDPGELAGLVADKKLGQAAITPGQAVAFMLATPIEAVKEPLDLAQAIFEDKLDGVRAQAHVWNAQVRLFARGLDDVTNQFPEIATALARLPRPAVLDGEIIAVRPDGQARPFQALQARLNRASPGKAVIAKTPVAFVAYDCLFDGEPLIDRPWRERRTRLEALPVRANAVQPFDVKRPLEAQLEQAFAEARKRGNEGLMLKATDSLYEAGRRGSAWRKVKKALATLDVVITQAERGHGKRAGVLSDYTFAVWNGPRLVEIGRAYSGLTDVEIDALTARLEALTIEQRGPFHVV